MIFQRYSEGRSHFLAYATAALFACVGGESTAAGPENDKKGFRAGTPPALSTKASGANVTSTTDLQRQRVKMQATELLVATRRAERLSHDLKVMHNIVRYYREFHNPLDNLLQHWPNAKDADYALYANLEDCATAGRRILTVGKSIKRHELQKKHLTRERNAYLELMQQCEQVVGGLK